MQYSHVGALDRDTLAARVGKLKSGGRLDETSVLGQDVLESGCKNAATHGSRAQGCAADKGAADCRKAGHQHRRTGHCKSKEHLYGRLFKSLMPALKADPTQTAG